MSEPSSPDYGTVAVVRSPIASAQSDTLEEPSEIILDQQTVSQTSVVAPCPTLLCWPLQRSDFNNVADTEFSTLKPNSHQGKIFDLDLRTLPPSKKYTLEESFTKQIEDARSERLNPFRKVSEQIIQTVRESLDGDTKESNIATGDPETIRKVCEILDKLFRSNIAVSATSQYRNIQFIEEKFRSQAKKSSRAVTPARPEYYDQILSSDLITQAKAIFNSNKAKRPSETHCIALKAKKSKATKPTRCSQKTNLEPLRLKILLKDLSSIPRPYDIAKVAKILLDILDMVYCTRHHLRKKRLMIYQMCTYVYGDMSTSDGGAGLKCLADWVWRLTQGEELETSELLTTASSSDAPSPLRLSNSTSPRIKPEVADDTARPHVVFVLADKPSWKQLIFKSNEFVFSEHTILRTLEPYHWGERKHFMEPANLVQSIIDKKLTNADQKAKGSVYVYSLKKSFGFVKIGYSTHVEERMEIWEESCQELIHEHNNLLEGFDRLASHPRRLEELVHAEFKKERYQLLWCEHCGKTHREWFKVAADEAQKVIKKWTLWMQQNPYDDKGYLKTGAERVEIPVLGGENKSRLSIPAPRRSSARIAQRDLKTRQPSLNHGRAESARVR